MATASQDRYVRVWSFEDLHQGTRVDLSRLDAYAPKPQLRLGGGGAGGQKTVAVVCEALLAGHEDWVHGVRWMVAGDGDQQLTLLSSSMDRTMMLWQQVSDGVGVPGAAGTYVVPPQDQQRIVRSIPWFVSITGCQKRCDSNERATLGCRRTWLSASCLRAISRPPHILTSLLAADGAALFEDGAALWQSVSVVGDAGINHLGYYTCAWRPGGRSIATHGMSWMCG